MGSNTELMNKQINKNLERNKHRSRKCWGQNEDWYFTHMTKTILYNIGAKKELEPCHTGISMKKFQEQEGTNETLYINSNSVFSKQYKDASENKNSQRQVRIGRGGVCGGRSKRQMINHCNLFLKLWFWSG